MTFCAPALLGCFPSKGIWDLKSHECLTARFSVPGLWCSGQGKELVHEGYQDLLDSVGFGSL